MGGFEEATKAIQTAINFSELTSQYKGLEAQLKRVQDYIPTMRYILGKFPGMAGDIYLGTGSASGLFYLQGQIKQMESDLLSQISQNQMKQVLAMFQMLPSYQAGISYVPRTGPAILHEGERVTSKMSKPGILFSIFLVPGIPKTLQGKL